MLKVTRILKIDSLHVTCEFNNGLVRTIDVGPIITNHSKLEGIEKLKNAETFAQVSIGVFGEIFWEKLITITYKGKSIIWNYDISPEYILENAI